jgi:leucyl-tRNA synthetase
MEPYNPKIIESAWQKKWAEAGLNETVIGSGKKKLYVLDMFPYPSGEGLHVGHPKGYIATDIYSRMKRMQGYEVLHPMGWDAFGLPAEQFALKHKVHPRVAVEKNIARFKEQLSLLGFNYDWTKEINTTDPEFYRWTQWIFKQMWKKGLAYESNEPINWCPSCKTGLANEDLESDGTCERCGTKVEKKPLRQWVLKITDYADRLIADLGKLDWPEGVKLAQKNWIGRNYGVKYSLKIKGTDKTVETYSTHYEAFYADTFAVIAADHKELPELVKDQPNKDEILAKAREIAGLRDSAGFKAGETVEGVFTGLYLEDPITGKDFPLWVSSYALPDYGTGIVKCSAHDTRDFAFAKKYNLPLHVVLLSDDESIRSQVENHELCFSDFDHATILEPAEFKGKRPHDVREEVAHYLEAKGYAVKSTQYKLKDWVFARQRYWGEPFPMVFDENHVPYAVADSELPVRLPDVEAYEPTGTGESPLAAITEWVNVTGYLNEDGDFVRCDASDPRAKTFTRETNTMPQWAGSSWYYLRFLDPHNEDMLVDPAIEKKWQPVDVYVGGDHATRHLIYARFWHKFLFDVGVVSDDEPFSRLEFLGFILAEDGRKMSKRLGNVINPDDVVADYGADTLRVYEMFMAPFEQTVAWDTKSIIGAERFLERVWKLRSNVKDENDSDEMKTVLHRTIKKVTEDIDSFKFNTAISSMMIALNKAEGQGHISPDTYAEFLKLLAPFAPHITEELWSSLGEKESIHAAQWPSHNPGLLVENEVTYALQVGGKLRGTLVLPRDMAELQVLDEMKKMEAYKKHVGGQVPRKVIFVPNKLINIVI